MFSGVFEPLCSPPLPSCPRLGYENTIHWADPGNGNSSGGCSSIKLLGTTIFFFTFLQNLALLSCWRHLGCLDDTSHVFGRKAQTRFLLNKKTNRGEKTFLENNLYFKKRFTVFSKQVSDNFLPRVHLHCIFGFLFSKHDTGAPSFGW